MTLKPKEKSITQSLVICTNVPTLLCCGRVDAGLILGGVRVGGRRGGRGGAGGMMLAVGCNELHESTFGARHKHNTAVKTQAGARVCRCQHQLDDATQNINLSISVTKQAIVQKLLSGRPRRSE